MKDAMPLLRGAKGAVFSLTTACAPHFILFRTVFGASRNDKTTNKNGTRKITLNHNSSLKFSRFFAKLLATNCSASTCRNNPSYQYAFTMCRGIGIKAYLIVTGRPVLVRDYNLKQYVKAFFKFFC